MTNLLLRICMKNKKDIENAAVRKAYGTFSGAVGIVCNLLLFIAKLAAGLLSVSVSVIADAFNNLSDAASSVVTLIGFRMAGRPADDKHPFGHGRMEYLAGFIVSMLILWMGVELGKTSLQRIFSPEDTVFHWLSFGILLASILVKLWMYFFNRKIGKLLQSSAMQAAAMDSFSDMLSTGVVAVGALLSHWFGWHIDGYIGVVVALFIVYTGITTIRDTMDLLLGGKSDAAFVQSVREKVLSYDVVIGVHDLIAHNYGPHRYIISLHAEVPSTMDLLELHDQIDNIEREVRIVFGCECVIHMDPIVTHDSKINAVRERLKQVVAKVDPSLEIHDFRMVQGPTHSNLIFDVVVPYGLAMSDAQIRNQISAAVKEWESTYEVVLHIDKPYA